MGYISVVLIICLLSGLAVLGIPDNPLLNVPKTFKFLGMLILIACTVMICFCYKARYSWSKPALVIVSVFFFLQAAAAMGFFVTVTIFNSKDKAQNLKVEEIQAKGQIAGKVLIVYHPGGSSFTKEVVRSFGEGIASKGYTVTIESAGSKIKSVIEDYKMVILASPVYNKQPRPPLKEFVERNSLKNLPVYLILTGSHTKRVQSELENIAPLISKSGGKLIGNKKYTKKVSMEEIFNTGAEVAEKIE